MCCAFSKNQLSISVARGKIKHSFFWRQKLRVYCLLIKNRKVTHLTGGAIKTDAVLSCANEKQSGDRLGLKVNSRNR